MHVRVTIEFREKPYSPVQIVRDRTERPCGDYGQESLDAIKEDVCRRIEEGWEYLAKRDGLITECES